MIDTALFHGTFTLKREWSATPERIFAAWSDPLVKTQWFTGPADEWTQLQRSMDFRVGGKEVLEGRFHESGLETLYEARFHVIEPSRRLVYAYDLHLSGHFHSVTLSSLELTAAGEKTQVSYTEQIIFLNGKDGTNERRHGTEYQFGMIEAALQLT